MRLTLRPTLMALPALLVLIGLGVWQLERRAWKGALIETRTARVAVPAVALAKLAPPTTTRLASAEYRRVILHGRFLHDREMHLSGRSWGGRLGYNVVTPLALTDGGTILVDRGWVPRDRKDPASRGAGQLAGAHAIIAHLRAQPPKGRFSPDNEPAKDFWFRVDIPAMAAHARMSGTRPYYAQAASPTPPGGWPRPVPIRVNLPNDHLKYAITWFALAAALLAVYLLYHRRPRSA